MNKRKWIIGSSLVLLVLAGTCVWAAAAYQPLLYSVQGETVRRADWDAMHPVVFNGIPTITDDVEREKLEQRSKEELVLAKARELGIAADEKKVDQQIEQIGKTPEERQSQLQQMGLTETQVRDNYRRAMTAFQLKTKITQGITVSDPEISKYFEDNKELFKAPEFRSVYYMKAKTSDVLLKNELASATPDTFPTEVSRFNDQAKDRLGGWHELIGKDHLAQHLSAKIGETAYSSALNQLVGPIEENGYNYWLMVNAIQPEKQFTLQEEHAKIKTTMLADKQNTMFRKWLDEQKSPLGYYYDVDNLTRSRLAAFWHDLPENLKLLFS